MQGYRDLRPLLAQLTGPGAGPFALLYRQDAGQGVEILRGKVTEHSALDDVAVPAPNRPVLQVVPYRQIAERGLACHDDGAPLLAMHVEHYETVLLADLLAAIQDAPPPLADGGFDICDDDYASIVRTVLDKEIAHGAGSNFVVRRCYEATIPHCTPRSAIALFASLLAVEQGAYWTFVVHTGSLTFVGASPERHVSLNSGVVVMNPISGTYRYPPTGPTAAGVLRFLADQKETDELWMVLDEELKMMSALCPDRPAVAGPRLRPMARLAHTEYLLEGRTPLAAQDVLRGTLPAPTVTGSPVESACRVIRRYEPGGRGYYSGAVALLRMDADGVRTMDSAILIRTAEIDQAGRVRIGVGATLVRDSDPDSEVAETHAKVAGLLAAFGGGAERTAIAGDGKFATDPLVLDALRRRNTALAPFWLARTESVAPELRGRRALVIDAEDGFTTMLGKQLTALGMHVSVRTVHQLPEHDDSELVVLGPGPGDPTDGSDPRIRALRSAAVGLVRTKRKFLAVCLGHQVLCDVLGLDVIRMRVPNQGTQRKVELFGASRSVAFYNSFVALSDKDIRRFADVRGEVELSRDPRTHEVHALRCADFVSAQFHPESAISLDGLEILRDLLGFLSLPRPVAAS
ncbi:phenazine-specific anthranilate synthase component I [Kibdelosporangium aridum]|uniref:anthranilate synthase n=1 Tax=Kibdelosporangium aridum TaxID=2030 RepID=A0A428Z593_KIBAR|nr:anthranilate synthase family protein [Kibdelosporangium aridum]RSM81990.1 phenazine-specific anthranilate synthase component I [Kibdelosporangium aridum]